MKSDSPLLLQQLTAIAQQDLQTALSFKNSGIERLNQSPSPGAWSALQCLEHLNLYAAFYLPEIEKALNTRVTPRPFFTSGFMGNMLVNMVMPDKSKKMKTFAVMDPQGRAVSIEALDLFIANQQKLQQFLQDAQQANLNKRAVAVTFTKLVKLRLGDALRFMVYHHQRHVQQAVRAAG